MKRKLLLLSIAVPAFASAAWRIDCHVDFEGEGRVFVSRPVASPYGVASIAVGDIFLFRTTFQDRPADVAGVSIATYRSGDEGPVMIHQTTHPWPPAAGGRRARHGFTGLQRVFEPGYDGELEYWCEAVNEGANEGARRR